MPLAELPIPGTPVRELVVRGIIISCALTIAFRPAGRREFGQLGALDLPLVVSGATSPALNVNDASLRPA